MKKHIYIVLSLFCLTSLWFCENKYQQTAIVQWQANGWYAPDFTTWAHDSTSAVNHFLKDNKNLEAFRVDKKGILFPFSRALFFAYQAQEDFVFHVPVDMQENPDGKTLVFQFLKGTKDSIWVNQEQETKIYLAVKSFTNLYTNKKIHLVYDENPRGFDDKFMHELVHIFNSKNITLLADEQIQLDNNIIPVASDTTLSNKSYQRRLAYSENKKTLHDFVTLKEFTRAQSALGFVLQGNKQQAKIAEITWKDVQPNKHFAVYLHSVNIDKGVKLRLQDLDKSENQIWTNTNLQMPFYLVH
jgi:hypothetical protein